MRLPTRGRSGALKFNLTPMIDVVFNLIIFFLAASHLARSESLAPVKLPEASTGRPEDAEKQRRMTVTITAAGTYHVGNTPHTLDDIERQLLAERAADPAKPHEFELRIRTDRDVPYRQIEPLLMTCARTGITKIKFAVLPGVD